MLVILSCLTVSFFIIIALNGASMLAGERIITSREESSSYECGFEHHNVSRIPISLRYYLLTLLFLLFDLEVVFLLFLPQVFSGAFSMVGLSIAFGFIAGLLGGLVYEWVDGSLEWLL